MNHFPSWVSNGHGWSCPEGGCLLCRAVDHATACGAVVVAAAGNGHLHAQTLRENGEPLPSGAELLCPGQAKNALTVGAIEKSQTVRLYPLSSRGFPRPGIAKPDLVAPGVDVISTVPIPENGFPCSPLDLFGMGSGTSVATAVVAGAVALLIEKRRTMGLSCTPASIRWDLLSRCVPLPYEEESQEGTARWLDLSTLLP
jgi:hypothetical protein